MGADVVLETGLHGRVLRPHHGRHLDGRVRQAEAAHHGLDDRQTRGQWKDGKWADEGEEDNHEDVSRHGE